MAYPKEAPISQNQGININSQAQASPGNQTIGNNDTIQFNNNSAYQATITFDDNTVFGNPPPIPASGSSAALSPKQQNITTNYYVSLASSPVTNNGPFSVEVGTGALPVNLNYNPATQQWSANPSHGAIPNHGSVNFANRNPTLGCTVHFSSSGAFGVLDQPVAASSSVPLTAQQSNTSVTYTIGTTVMEPKEPGKVRNGGNSIKIG